MQTPSSLSAVATSITASSTTGKAAPPDFHFYVAHPLFDGATVGIEHTRILTSVGDLAHAVVHALRISRLQLRHGLHAELIEIDQHLPADAAKVLELPRSHLYIIMGTGVCGVREYDLITEWYASERDDQTGVPEVAALAASIPHGSRALDIGCGNGIPITRALLRCGHRVIGLDSSGAMLQRLRQNCPEAPAVRGIVQACPFADRMFDAAVAWGVMFHLSPEDQIKAIARVARVLKIGAPFLFTSGDVDGLAGKEGMMNGVVFRYFSFSIENYRRILGDEGFTLRDVHEDKGNNTYYLAMKKL